VRAEDRRVYIPWRLGGLGLISYRAEAMPAVGTVPGSCQPGMPAFASKHGTPVASSRPGHGAGRAVPVSYRAKNVPGLKPNGGPHCLNMYSVGPQSDGQNSSSRALWKALVGGYMVRLLL
jgi:hypothetical protein